MKNYGTVQAGWLIKRGKQVQKFFKFDGYGIAFKALEEIKGVVLHTEYDGTIYITAADIMKHGIPYEFEGEHQLIVPVKYWKQRETNSGGETP